MLIAAALSLALIQDPVSHEQAMICTGLLANMIGPLTARLQDEPTDRNRRTLDAAVAMNEVADADRRAAAAREGLSAREADRRLTAWTTANPHSDETLSRHIDGCLALYFERGQGRLMLSGA